MTTIFKELSRKIDDLARRTIAELLDGLAVDLKFEPGHGLHVSHESEQVTVLLRCVRRDGQQCYYTGLVMTGFPPQDDVAGIHWQVTDHDGRSIGGGVTETGGHFSFALTIMDEENSQPLGLRFGDQKVGGASQTTEVDHQIARLFSEFWRVNAGRDEPVSVTAPLVQELGERWQNAWRCPASLAAESPAALAAQSSDDGPRPSAARIRRTSSSGQASPSETVHEPSSAYNNGEATEPPQEDENRWIDRQGDQIVVRVPAELVPYGVVRIVAQVNDQLVGTCLLPLIKYGDPRGEFSIRSNKCMVERVVGERDPRTVNWYAQPALENTLAWFPAKEVAELLERPEVQDRAELRQRIELLLELVNERQQENEDDDLPEG